MEPLRRAGIPIFALILLGSIGCDHATKRLATHVLADSAPVELAAGTIRLELMRNPGGFLSAGAGLPPLARRLAFGVAPPLLIGLIGLLLLRGGASGRALTGYALVAGGGLANWLDRLLNDGAVTDFVQVGVGPLRTGIFNLADVGILAGAGLLLLCLHAGNRVPPPAG